MSVFDNGHKGEIRTEFVDNRLLSLRSLTRNGGDNIATKGCIVRLGDGTTVAVGDTKECRCRIVTETTT